MNMELTTLARACGKGDVHHLEREDLVALTNEQPRSKLRGIEHPSLNSFRGKPRGIEPEEIEAAAMAGVPLAGTQWIPGRGM